MFSSIRYRNVSLLAAVAAAVLILAGQATADLVSLYSFEGNGNDSAGPNNATPFGGPTFVPGRKGQAVELNGTSQYFDTAPATTMRLQGDFTASAWIYPDATNGDRTILGTDATGGNVGLHLVVRNDRAHLGFYGNDTGGSRTIPVGEWTHVAWQYNAQTQKIWVNGELDAANCCHSAFNGIDTVKIGRWASTNYFDGKLDEVAVFNHPLSYEQIQALAAGASATSIGALDALDAPGQLFVLPTGPSGEWNVYAYDTANRTWDEARVYANNTAYGGVPGHLATMRDATENGTIAIIGGGDRWIGLTDSDQTSTLDGATMGGTEAGTNPNGGWAWVNGEAFAYQNFAAGEPNDSGGAEDAVQLRSDTQWNDHQAGGTLGQGDQRGPSLIEYDTLLAAPPQLPGRGQLDPITGNYYERIAAGFTWDEARLDATNRYMAGVAGHLATIADGDENEAVRLAGGTADKWIGATDSDQVSALDGTPMGGTELGNTSGNPYPPAGNRGDGFVWVTGEPMSYRNWGSGEPNDSSGEDAAHIRSDGFWNDQNAGTSLGETDHRINSVVEYDLPKTGATFNYLERKAAGTFTGNGQVNSLAEAKTLLGLPSGDPDILAEAAADIYAVSFHDPQASGGQASFFRRPFLTDTGGDDNDFAVQVTGKLFVSPGEWTFAVAHDDDFELQIGPNLFTSPGCCGNPTLTTFDFSEGGAYDMTLTWFERAGGAVLQLFAAQGRHTAFDPAVFALVGDIYNGGLALVPEPSTLALGLLGLALLGGFTRRRRPLAA